MYFVSPTSVPLTLKLIENTSSVVFGPVLLLEHSPMESSTMAMSQGLEQEGGAMMLNSVGQILPPITEIVIF